MCSEQKRARCAELQRQKHDLKAMQCTDISSSACYCSAQAVFYRLNKANALLCEISASSSTSIKLKLVFVTAFVLQYCFFFFPNICDRIT